MRNYTKEIYSKIEALPYGSVFIATDFLDVAMYETIRKILNRMVGEGIIFRVLKGVYYKARHISLIDEYEMPDPNEVAKALARKYNWTIAPTGNTALNMLGLSTQVPSQWVYISDGRYVEFTYENIKIVFKKTTNSNISKMSELTALIIQAIKAIGRDDLTEEKIKRIQGKLTIEEKEKLVEEGKRAPAWIYKTIIKIKGEA